MTKLIHGFYNMDTNSVELTYNDGSVLTIDCEEVGNYNETFSDTFLRFYAADAI